MERLTAAGDFSPPSLSSLETVLRETLSWNRGRVFADLWDARQFADKQELADAQMARLREMNLTQTVVSHA